jgi:hypothetical protein
MKSTVLLPAGNVGRRGAASPDPLGSLVLQNQLSVGVADDDSVGARVEDGLGQSALVRSEQGQPLDFAAERFDALLRGSEFVLGAEVLGRH